MLYVTELIILHPLASAIFVPDITQMLYVTELLLRMNCHFILVPDITQMLYVTER